MPEYNIPYIYIQTWSLHLKKDGLLGKGENSYDQDSTWTPLLLYLDRLAHLGLTILEQRR